MKFLIFFLIFLIISCSPTYKVGDKLKCKTDMHTSEKIYESFEIFTIREIVNDNILIVDKNNENEQIKSTWVIDNLCKKVKE